MNLSCNKPITSGAGETLTITCFTCGMPSSKEWAQKVRSRPSSTHLRSYYPFLLQIHPPPGSALKEDGSTFVCAFCHASLEAQWKNYERQPAGIPPMNRKYNLYKFICAVCGVETYRKRVRTLPFQEFPFLANQRVAGSLTLGNNPLAIVCLDCSETLWAQSAEYDRWGLPVHKRMFNWMARPPPPEDSVEATVARLPSGETQLPRCPPTEPIIISKHKEPPPSSTYDAVLSSKKGGPSKVHNSLSESSSSGNEPIIVRKSSLTSTTNPMLDASGMAVHSQSSSSQPPIVTVAPMSAHTTTLSSLRKETMSVPPNLSSGVYQKYEPVSVSCASGLQPSQLNHPHPLFTRSPLFSASSYGPHGHSFPWSGEREVGGSSIGDHYAYSSSAAAAAAAAAAESLQATGYPSLTWMQPPPPSSNLMQYQNYMPASFASRSYNLNEQFYNTSHSFYPPSPESNSNNSSSNVPTSNCVVTSSPSATGISTYASPYGFRTSSSASAGRSSSPVLNYPQSASASSALQSGSHSHHSSSISNQFQIQNQKLGNSSEACNNSDDPDIPVYIPARKTSSISAPCASTDRDINSEAVKRKSSGDDGSGSAASGKISYKMPKNSEQQHSTDPATISYRGTALPKKLLSRFNQNQSQTSDIRATGVDPVESPIDVTTSGKGKDVNSHLSISGSDSVLPLPSNFKPKSNAIRNHMNEKEKSASRLNHVNSGKDASTKSANGPLSEAEVNPAPAVTLPIPKKWQWQSQYNHSRTATSTQSSATTTDLRPKAKCFSGSSSSNMDLSGGRGGVRGGGRSRNGSESEPMDFSIVNRNRSEFTGGDKCKKPDIVKKSSEDEEVPDVVIDLSFSSTSRHRVHPPHHYRQQYQRSSHTNHTTNSSSSNSNKSGNTAVPKSSKKFMIAYLCQSETSSDSPPHRDNGGEQYKSLRDSEPERQSQISAYPAIFDHTNSSVHDAADNNYLNDTEVEVKCRSRSSSRSNSSEPSGRRSVIVTLPGPGSVPLKAVLSHKQRESCGKSSDFLNACHPKRRKRLRQRREKKSQGEYSDKESLSTAHLLGLEREEDGSGGAEYPQDNLYRVTKDEEEDTLEKDSSSSASLSVAHTRKSDESGKSSNGKNEGDVGDEVTSHYGDGDDWSVNEEETGPTDDRDATSDEILEIDESDPRGKATPAVDYKRAQEYAKKIVGEYKVEERHSRILKRKLEVDQEQFLSSLGLITLQKKSDLELNVLIQRSNHYTLPPLKFRPSTPPKVQLSEEFEKKLLQIAFDDPSLSKKSDLSSDEVSFLAHLDLKPASIPEKNKREKEWRIILTERMMREKRGRYLRGAKKPWDSYCGASKLLTPTIRSPCDTSLDFFGSLSLTLPTEKNEFSFPNPSRANGSSDLLRIAQNCTETSAQYQLTDSPSDACPYRDRNGSRGLPESITVSAMCIMQPVISYPKYIPSYVTQVSVPSSTLQPAESSSEVAEEDANSVTKNAASSEAEGVEAHGASPAEPGQRSSRSGSSGESSGSGDVTNLKSPNNTVETKDKDSGSEAHTISVSDSQASITLTPGHHSEILKVPVINGASVPPPPTTTTPVTLTSKEPGHEQFESYPEQGKMQTRSCSSSHNKTEDRVPVMKQGESSSADLPHVNSNVNNCTNSNNPGQQTSIVDAIIDADILNCSKFETEIQNLINSVPVPSKSKVSSAPLSLSSKSEENRQLGPESIQGWKKLKKYLKTRQNQVKAIEDKLKKREKQILNQLRTCTKNTH